MQRHHPPTTLPLPCSPAHPSHRGFPGKPRTRTLSLFLISPSFLACSEYLPSDTYATRTHKPNCNHYRPTPHPRRLLPTCALHQPANHPQTQTNNSAYPRALKRLSKEEGEGGARPPRPQLFPATHPPVLKPLNLDSSLYSTPLPDTKTTLHTTPPHHRGLIAACCSNTPYPSLSVVSATTVVST